jgi:HK97 family phage portal protein
MGLFDSFRRNKKVTNENGQGSRIQIGWSYPARRNTSSWLETFHTSPRMNSVAMISSDVARAKLSVYYKADYEKNQENASELRDHPFIELMKDPAPGFTGMDWYSTMFLITASRSIVGEAFALIERDKLNQPRQLLYIPNTWVISIPTSKQYYFELSPGGNAAGSVIKVLPSDMVYFKEPNLTDPYNRGRGRSERIGDEIETDEYSAKWAKNTMFNSARPEIVVSMPEAGAEAADRLKQSWLEKFGGYRNANGAAFTGSKLEIHKLTTSPKELDFVESRRYLKDVVRQEFGIPPELFGDLSNSNRSTVDASDYLYKKNVLSREIERTEFVFNNQLMRQYKDDVILVYENIVPEDDILLTSQLKDGFALNAVTVNEYRKALKLPAISGGDVLRPVVAPPVISNLDCGCGLEHKALDVKKKSLTRVLKSIDSAAQAGENAFIAATKKWSTKQQKAFLAAFKLARENGLTGLAAIDQAILETFGVDADKLVSDGMAPAWLEGMKKGAWVAAETLGRGVSFDLLNPLFLDWVSENGLHLAKLINDTTKSELAITLTEGIKAGESIKDLADRIQAVYSELNGDDMERYRAVRIARTETIRTVNAGAFETYKAANITQVMWLANSGGDFRPEHQAISGTVYNINEGILVMGELMRYPGDPNGSAKNTINCRCSVVAIVD